MHMPPPNREQLKRAGFVDEPTYERKERPRPDNWWGSGKLNFQERAPGAEHAYAEVRELVRSRYEFERAAVRDEIDTAKRREIVDAIPERDEPPRRVTAEWKNDDGSTTRQFSDGSQLTKHRGGLIEGRMADG